MGRAQFSVTNLHTTLGLALAGSGESDAARHAFAAAVESARAGGYTLAERRAREAAAALR